MERTNRPRPGCDQIQEAISATLDQERPDVDATTVDLHLGDCATCRTFADGAAMLHRRIRVRPADPVPNLAITILDAVPLRPTGTTEPAWWSARAPWARIGLLLVAALQLVLAVPAFAVGHDHGASVHLARELGSWDVALAVAWVAVVLRPSRAAGLLPFATAFAAVMVGTSVLDVAGGHQSPLDEVHHLLHFAGLTCTWVLSRSGPKVERLIPSFR
jgi:predicted anti-sigma-YlaC factor YlaD